MENLKNALRSLASIEKIDDYGMFRMTYFGDYGFDDFLKVGAKCEDDLDAFFSKHLFSDVSLNMGKPGCTVFWTRNKKGEVLFCRNYDYWPYAPSLQLFTNPNNGHASVSTVYLLFLEYGEGSAPSGLDLNSFPTVLAPYAPMDGANEKGLAIALLAVSTATPTFDESKVTLDVCASIRLVLDKAATTDEAIALLRQHNIYFAQDIYCQFLIADASGKSAIINYWENDLKVTTVDTPYQIAANFIPYNGLNIPMGKESSAAAFTGFEFERYNTAKAAIEAGGGVLSEEQAVDVLAQVGCQNGGLQWSVIYNLTTLEGIIFAGKNKGNLISFNLQGGAK